MKAKDLRPGDIYLGSVHPVTGARFTVAVQDGPVVTEAGEIVVTVVFNDGGIAFRVFNNGDVETPYVRPQTPQEES